MEAMQKPLHHWFFFWLGPAVMLVICVLAMDSYFHESSMRIPRGDGKVPAHLRVQSGIIGLEIEVTPDPHVEKTFAFHRSGLIKDRGFHVWSRLYSKFDAYKYQGASKSERMAAQAAGLKSPMVVHSFSLSLFVLFVIVTAIWWFAVRKRSRRMAREHLTEQEESS